VGAEVFCDPKDITALVRHPRAYFFIEIGVQAHRAADKIGVSQNGNANFHHSNKVPGGMSKGTSNGRDYGEVILTRGVHTALDTVHSPGRIRIRRAELVERGGRIELELHAVIAGPAHVSSLINDAPLAFVPLGFGFG